MPPTPAPTLPPRSQQAAILGRWFTGVRRAGFLALLSADAWHTLSAILSFRRADGSCCFTVEQLASTLGQPRNEAEHRLQSLTDFRWKDAPLLRLQPSGAAGTINVVLAPLEALAITSAPAVESSEAAAPEIGLPSELTQDLGAVGLNPTQIARLAERFPVTEIKRQLVWLPARGARNPAALLLRAIEQRWDEPKDGA